eukprot:12060149-Alexandrium_andersonii.AAC.1
MSALATCHTLATALLSNDDCATASAHELLRICQRLFNMRLRGSTAHLACPTGVSGTPEAPFCVR